MRFKIIAVTAILSVFLTCNSDAVAGKSEKKAPCPDLENTYTEMKSASTVWDQVTDLRIRDAGYSKAFESHTIKKLYKSRAFSKFKQTGCTEVIETLVNGTEIPYEVLEKNPMKLVLKPKHPTLDDVAKDGTVVFIIRRFSGNKIIERTQQVTLSYTQGCGKNEVTESHPVEVKRIYSWKKPIQFRRVATSHLLDMLNSEIVGNNSGIQRKIAGCE